jgi:hypothetical protein
MLTKRRYSTKRGSWKTMGRCSFVATISISSMRARHSDSGEIGGCIPCSSAVAVELWSVLKHKCSSPEDFSTCLWQPNNLRRPKMEKKMLTGNFLRSPPMKSLRKRTFDIHSYSHVKVTFFYLKESLLWKNGAVTYSFQWGDHSYDLALIKHPGNSHPMSFLC